MRTKTMNACGISVCLAVSIAFTSCKKEEIKSNDASINAQVQNDNAITNGLVAWYTFDGDVLDHSGNGNDVVINTARPATGYNGQPKTAYKFNGNDSYMMVYNSETLQDMSRGITLYALVKPLGFYEGLCHGNRILNKGADDQSNGLYLLGFDDQPYYNFSGCTEPVKRNRQTFYGSFGDNQFSTIHSISTDYIARGSWYKVAFTCNGKGSRLYVDGVLKSRDTNASFSYNSNFANLFFGKLDNSTYPYWFNGLIDEIMIYKRALKPEEIQQL